MTSWHSFFFSLRIFFFLLASCRVTLFILFYGFFFFIWLTFLFTFCWRLIRLIDFHTFWFCVFTSHEGADRRTLILFLCWSLSGWLRVRFLWRDGLLRELLFALRCHEHVYHLLWARLLFLANVWLFSQLIGLALKELGIDRRLVELKDHIAVEGHWVPSFLITLCRRFLRDKLQHFLHLLPREAASRSE